MIYVYVWTDVATLQRTKTERMKLLKQSPQGHLGCVFFWDSAGPLKASSMFWPLIELVSRIPCVKTEWYWVKSTMKYTHTMSWFQKHAHQRHELLHDIHMYIWRFLKMGVPQ